MYETRKRSPRTSRNDNSGRDNSAMRRSSRKAIEFNMSPRTISRLLTTYVNTRNQRLKGVIRAVSYRRRRMYSFRHRRNGTLSVLLTRSVTGAGRRYKGLDRRIAAPRHHPCHMEQQEGVVDALLPGTLRLPQKGDYYYRFSYPLV